MAHSETIDQSELSRLQHGESPLPGLVLLFSAGEPLQGALPLMAGEILIGRDSLPGVKIQDSRMSRRHTLVRREGAQWIVADQGSRNGTAVDGQTVEGEVRSTQFKLLRTGKTLFLFVDNVRPFMNAPVEVRDGCVLGPLMQTTFQQIQQAASAGVVHINGETGAGKELAARQFHQSGSGKGKPFVSINCATIPEGVAERLLFGAQKGAYSGAHADAPGYILEADGGTLFLDEVGELDLNVQAKLLRVIETREVFAVGASRPKRVDVRICSATHRDLREQVAAGRFREDLYYRIGLPKVSLPPLRERPEDIPFLLERQVRAAGPSLEVHVSLVESCVMRHWPGNVRELLGAARDAAQAALAQSSSAVQAHHLPAHAGERYADNDTAARDSGAPGGSKAAALPSREAILATLQRCGGRVATAARELGVHRNQLRRWLEKNEVDASAFVDADDSDDSNSDST
jgi:transcriptional regulator of acetoin/glycerol metabolism